jgi:protein-disulfide isomerase
VTKGSYYDWVKNVAADGAKNNINSTPTVKVNGKELDRATQYMDSAAFKKALTSAGA